jgi:peptidoglycan/LPS O-acetylase OafA/YrhL
MRIDRLDGLRAIAILMVLLFHRGHFGYGWTGVDLFFVLSGFLITGILRKTRANEDYWFRFYIRRAARVLPPLLLLLLFYSMAARPPLLTILGYTFFAGNFMGFTHYGRSMLAALWSLAVEEHFYLLWPLLVLLCERRRLMIGLVALLIAEPALRAVLTPYMTTYQPFYYLTPFRIDSLAVGCLLALMTEEDVNIPFQRWAGSAALLLGSTMLLLHKLLPHFGRHTNSALFNSLGYSLVSCACLSVLAWVLVLEGGVANTVLSWKPLTYIGRISYGIYLLDIPATSVLDRIAHESSQLASLRALLPVDLAVIFGLAALSFHLIEKRIIKFAKIRSEMEMEGGEYWWRTEG